MFALVDSRKYVKHEAFISWTLLDMPDEPSECLYLVVADVLVVGFDAGAQLCLNFNYSGRPGAWA